ncbi:MAG TPA: PEP/pyruvate-binding domain-containing protein [Lentimicrobium sp.]|nr:PEP/pyruvate-binding domain-containing protein [Lentimicrobium sp.]
MEPQKTLMSDALAANLEATRTDKIDIPAHHLSFTEVSKTYYSIHNRAIDCIKEFNHPYSNSGYIIGQLRAISLGDFWFYERLSDENAWSVIIELYQGLISRQLTDLQAEDLVHTLLELFEKFLASKNISRELHSKVLQLIEHYLDKKPVAVIHNSGYLVKLFTSTEWSDDYWQQALDTAKNVLLTNNTYWRDTTKVEQWLAERNKMFSTQSREKFTSIGNNYYQNNEKKIKEAKVFKDIELIPAFSDVSFHLRQLHHSFSRFHEKFYYILFLLHLEGMQNQKEVLMRDFNSLLRNIKNELTSDEVFGFLDNIFKLFNDLKSTNAGTVLDSILILGKEIFRTDNQNHISHFEKLLIRHGFIGPGIVYVSKDWQLQVNEYHIKNIRVWMELIEYSPTAFRELLSALIIHLRLGGVFVSDTDLFQRDVTALLNSDISPIFKQIKQLARLFPVYFNEIGAEGELREVTTAMDELSHRNDRLVHFLRKQIHTESNNTHIDLTRSIIHYWYDGDTSYLFKMLPEDVKASMSPDSRWFGPINQILQSLCEANNYMPRALMELPAERIKKEINAIPIDNPLDKQRLHYIFRLLELLKEKYSFNTVNIGNLMRKFNFFNGSDIDQLLGMLERGNTDRALRQVYIFIRKLNHVITDPNKTEGWEDIYHKRHIAIGIPSMYGKYREPKFEALGLSFRLEKIAAHLMEQLINSINLDYITAKTLRRIHIVFELFREGLELDGISDQGFNSNLKMFRYSLNSASFSVGQYINILQFMLSSVREIISKYFYRVYDRQLKVVIPQLYPNETKNDGPAAKQFHSRKSEQFYREMLSYAFMVQALDNFLVRILGTFRQMVDSYSEETLRSIMSYNTDLVVSPLYRETPEMDNQIFLGSKAYFLKKLLLLGFPIPPGFVFTTEVFRRRDAILKNPFIEKEFDQMIRRQIAYLEKLSGQQFGNPNNPLLLSVRSGTAISMPGAMNTYLNVGLNDQIVESLSKMPNYGWTSWDCYRRFLQSWGMSFGIPRDEFDQIMIDFKTRYNVNQKLDFTPAQMREMAFAYKDILLSRNIHFKDEPFEQLKQVIFNVFESWYSERAEVYRDYLQIADEWGTAVIVQKMVLGNIHRTSGTGVLFTHAPDIEKPGIHLYGDFTLCSQGEDIVAGLVNPMPLTERQRKKIFSDKAFSLQGAFPGIYKKLQQISDALTEQHGFSHQEIEFTFESENPDDLYILQTRDQDIRKPDLSYVFDVKSSELKILGRGIGLGRGVLNGILAFDMEDLKRFKDLPENKILVRPDTVPDDIGMIFECNGLITARGGATSHAAVTAVRLEKTCVVNCTQLIVNEREKTCSINGTLLKPGDKIAIDGNLGNIYLGNYKVKVAEIA